MCLIRFSTDILSIRDNQNVHIIFKYLKKTKPNFFWGVQLQIVACPFRDIISVDNGAFLPPNVPFRDGICKENIAYLRHAPYGLNLIFYRYIIPIRDNQNVHIIFKYLKKPNRIFFGCNWLWPIVCPLFVVASSFVRRSVFSRGCYAESKNLVGTLCRTQDA